MTTEELNTIVQAVIDKINEQVIDFDVVSSTPASTDLLSAVRSQGDGTYQGVTLKWDNVANAVTREAKGYRDEAASAKTNVENMKASVEQTVSGFNTLAEQKKTEVQGVYQNDLNELKGDLAYNHSTEITINQGSNSYAYNVIKDHRYTISLSSGSANIYTRSDPSGANIEAVKTGADAPITFEFIPTQDASYLFVFCTTNSTLTIYDSDAIGNRVDYLYNSNSKKYTVDKNGNGDFTRLRDGIAEAIKYHNSIVYVNSGSYDLLNEFLAEFNETMTSQQGIKLENDVTVIFASGAYVTCLYPNNGQRTDVDRYFSAFYSGENGGFTLENLNINVSNIRYCVHDDQPRASKLRRNRYINCIMETDNTNSPSGYYPECIGGGCSRNLEVVIDGCTFKSKKAETKVYDLVSYHNTNQFTDAMSNIYVRNCYFQDNGTFKCSYYGNSETVSNAFVCNNSLGAEPIIRYEVTGATTPQNFKLISWNNEIRTN